eukprot:56917_1
MLTIKQWAEQNYYMQQVEEINTTRYNDIIDMIRSFCERVSNPMDLYSIYKIDDDLWTVSQYIVAISTFVIKYTKHLKCPFQVDVPIILNISASSDSSNSHFLMVGDIAETLQESHFNALLRRKVNIQSDDTKFQLKIREFKQH